MVRRGHAGCWPSMMGVPSWTEPAPRPRTRQLRAAAPRRGQRTTAASPSNQQPAAAGTAMNGPIHRHRVQSKVNKASSRYVLTASKRCCVYIRLTPHRLRCSVRWPLVPACHLPHPVGWRQLGPTNHSPPRPAPSPRTVCNAWSCSLQFFLYFFIYMMHQCSVVLYVEM